MIDDAHNSLRDFEASLKGTKLWKIARGRREKVSSG
jgi:hypothetical protein